MRTDGPKFLDASLQVVERMGDETVVYFEHTNAALVARIDGSASVKPGDRLPLSLNSGAWHLFGAEGDELCLAHGSQ
jgi:multiple sugar transport system ATP-binding protein